MAVSGKVREPQDWKKSTGFFEAEVLCINPDREKLEKILNTSLDKDPEYLSSEEEEQANGMKKLITKLSVVFWVKDVKSNEVKSVRFFLKDAEKINRDKTKKQYINSIGSLSWADSPENLPDWFKVRAFRVAHDGEEELYNFIVNWLGKVDYKDTESSISFDWSKLMKGNVKELSEQINGEYCTTVVCLKVIRSVVKDEETKEYEQIYNRDFLPGYIMREIRLQGDKLGTDAYIERAKATEKKKRSKLQRFMLQATDSEHGIKDYFYRGESKEYDPADNVAVGDTTHIKDGDASY
jgi:hypothetical protein